MRQTIYDEEAQWEQADEDFDRLKGFVLDAVSQQELREVEARVVSTAVGLDVVPGECMFRMSSKKGRES
jgi:hypothetical protein